MTNGRATMILPYLRTGQVFIVQPNMRGWTGGTVSHLPSHCLPAPTLRLPAPTLPSSSSRLICPSPQIYTIWIDVWAESHAIKWKGIWNNTRGNKHGSGTTYEQMEENKKNINKKAMENIQKAPKKTQQKEHTIRDTM